MAIKGNRQKQQNKLKVNIQTVKNWK